MRSACERIDNIMADLTFNTTPGQTIGREMLIASTISEASDTNLGTIGYKPTDPIHVKFTRIDTTIYLSQAVVPPVIRLLEERIAKGGGKKPARKAAPKAAAKKAAKPAGGDAAKTVKAAAKKPAAKKTPVKKSKAKAHAD